MDYRLRKYKIKRDRDTETGFFIVNVPEAGQWGVGFQMNIRGTLYGVSIYMEQHEHRTN